MAVHAPYRFAPIARWVYFPNWAELVSHDVPFTDGLSGTIDIAMTAKTSILAGGARRAARRGDEKKNEPGLEGEVWPFQLPNGDWALPSATLQGMIRSILEIACFGKLGPWIDNKRFGIRDLQQAAEPFFQRRLAEVSGSSPIKIDPRVRVGWLRREGQKFFLRRCQMARVEYADLVSVTGYGGDPLPLNPGRHGDQRATQLYNRYKQTLKKTKTWSKKSDANMRYEWIRGELSQGPIRLYVEPDTDAARHPHRHDKLSIRYRQASSESKDGWEPKDGRIVLTGAPADPPERASDPHKHFEFFFFDDEPEKELAEFGSLFEEFKDIHEPADGRSPNPNWEYFRDYAYPGEEPFKKGGRMPIFFLPDSQDRIESFGLAFMFKLAHECSTHDLLGNSAGEHFCDNRHDLPTLIFGAKADHPAGGLKRRVAFDTAIATLPKDKVVQPGENPAILLSPKPSYYPAYVRQPGIASTRSRLEPVSTNNKNEPIFEPYATYTPLTTDRYTGKLKPEHVMPELAGAKIWPAKRTVDVPPLGGPDLRIANNRAIQNRLWALPEGTKFTTTLRFHNLRRVELGALLWALTFGEAGPLNGKENLLWHRVGMGKPFGFGALALRILRSDLGPNDGSPSPILEEVLGEFTRHMDRHYPADRKGEGGWAESVQVAALRKAANPNAQRGEVLTYMALKNHSGAKKDGEFLPRYAAGNELPGPLPETNCQSAPSSSSSGYVGRYALTRKGERVHCVGGPRYKNDDTVECELVGRRGRQRMRIDKLTWA